MGMLMHRHENYRNRRAAVEPLEHRPAVALESYTIAQLRELAQLHDVDLADLSRKGEIIAAITAAWEPAATAEALPTGGEQSA